MKKSSCHFVGKNRVHLYKSTLKFAKRKGTHFRVPFNGADDYFVIQKLPISSLSKAFRLNLDQRYALKTVH